MTIQVFAVLKDYFDKEFEMQGTIENITALKQHLAGQNPEAASVLDLCRFAVRNEFVDPDYPITTNDTICIIPPSSGG